ncbi:MAG TPA: hypothetical protein VHI77_09440 [Solirubrobacterales bacterium]|jgi:hypothetical protein|nr:hypothetical protein [Solirubrobacterales bacterium]
MAFQELTNIPIKHIDTVIDVISKGDGSQDHDEVAVTSSLELVAPIDGAEEALLLLPMSGEAQQKPIVRYSDEHVKDGAVFSFDPVERSVYDEELVERLEALADGTSKKEQKAVATQLERCADGLSAAVVRVKAGEIKLRLFYEIAAQKVEDRTFEFGVIGPLPSFVIQAGGSIGLLSILPRATTAVSAVALSDPNNPGSEIWHEGRGRSRRASCDRLDLAERSTVQGPLSLLIQLCQ